MLPGGPAAKLGNRYETWCAVAELVRLLHGETDTLRIEVPDTDKAEFVVSTGTRREAHQAKRSHHEGKWRFAALRDGGLISYIGEFLADDNNRFVFTSGSEARELLELVQAAKDAESIKEFIHSFVGETRRKKRFDTLVTDWNCEVKSAVQRLRRIDVRTVDEKELQERVRWAAMALFIADPESVLAKLRAIAEDSVHRTITRDYLVDELAKNGYRLRRVLNLQSAAVVIEKVTTRYLELARRRLIQQALVPRSVSVTLLSRLNATASDSVITGKAGSGKSASVIEVAEGLRARGQPVLAFRLDRIPSSVQTTTDLGNHLGLEESPVLVLAAAADATARAGVLIVDQLDAVSAMSGRNSAAFDLIERLIEEARGARAQTTIHTVVVCRSFDWKNDARLRSLLPEEHDQMDVPEFQSEEVNTVLTQAGFDPTLFTAGQLELLRLPQNLSLFLEAGFDPSLAPAFKTSVRIFDEYWENKRSAVYHTVTTDHWIVVMETLCDEMNATQLLSVPRGKLSTIPLPYLHQLASEGVLTFDGRRYGFGHESFFDYCFARVFVSRSEPMATFLTASEQHLFRRSQVRQVLAYLREADPQRYVQELEVLLSGQGVRAHIKDLAFALLTEVTDPTDREWAVWVQWTAAAFQGIESGVESQDKLSVRAWHRFFESKSWFSYVDRRGLIKDWLATGNERIVDTAVNYLWAHHSHAPDRVAALLEPYADIGNEWPARLRTLMERTQHHTSRRYFDLLLRLVDNGTLDDDSRSTPDARSFWLMLYSVSESRPVWVPEAVAHRLRRQLANIRMSGKDLTSGYFVGYDETAVRVIRAASKHAPAAFVEHLLPVVLEISTSYPIGDQLPMRDEVWSFLSCSEPQTGEQACLFGLVSALTSIAGTSCTSLHEVVSNLRGRDTYIANLLLQSVYQAAAGYFADEAVSILCQQPWRFQCGVSESPSWYAMMLIETVIRHCSALNSEKLESVILDYVGPFERPTAALRREGIRYNAIGRTSYSLLSVIPTEIRSLRANRYFYELKRRFGSPDNEARGVAGGFVESPIAETAAAMMTDDKWLRAIAKHNMVRPARSWPDFLKGGAHELSQVLGKQTKEDPERFAQLSLTFPVDAKPVYLERTLDALRDAPIDPELKLAVCCKAYADSRIDCGKSIADVLGSIANSLPDEAIEMLQWLATEHEDPKKEAWQEDAGNGQTYYNGDIYTNGINTTRGRAAEAIQRLILTDAAYIERFRTALDRMIADQSAAVRFCVAGILRAVAYHDKALGMSLFERMDLTTNQLSARIEAFLGSHLRGAPPVLRWIIKRVVCAGWLCVAGLLRAMAYSNRRPETLPFYRLNATDDRLLGTNHVVAFIRSHLRVGFPILRSIIKRMLRSYDANVCEAGARLASMAAMRNEQAANLCNGALRGRPNQRIGVAQVAAANLGVVEFRDWCEARLVTLFDDDDGDVRQRASFCFDRISADSLEAHENLIDAFCNSRAFAGGAFGLIRSLEESRSRLPGITCVVCERSLDHPSRDAFAVAKLIFRTYHQHQDDEWTSRTLDLIDRLCLEGYPGVGTEFEHFDR